MKVQSHQIDIMITRKVEQYSSIDLETALEYGIDDIDESVVEWDEDEYDRDVEYHVNGVVQKKQYDDALDEIKKLEDKVKKLQSKIDGRNVIPEKEGEE